jgi:hypothetical protein
VHLDSKNYREVEVLKSSGYLPRATHQEDTDGNSALGALAPMVLIKVRKEALWKEISYKDAPAVLPSSIVGLLLS